VLELDCVNAMAASSMLEVSDMSDAKLRRDETTSCQEDWLVLKCDVQKLMMSESQRGSGGGGRCR
jgi:hypothetical protein